MSLLEPPPYDRATADPADIDLPPTQPIDITAIIASPAVRD